MSLNARAFGARVGGRRRSTLLLMSIVISLALLLTVLVAGCSETDLADPEHAFLWQNGVMTDLGTLGGASSRAYAINDGGQVTGWAESDEGAAHAFLWSAGAMRDLGTLGGSFSVGRDLNSCRRVVGWSETASGAVHAFSWSAGAMVDLGTLGGADSRAYGIDGTGRVVGWAQCADGSRHACIWFGGKIIDLGVLEGEESQAFAVTTSYRPALRRGHVAAATVTVVGSQEIDDAQIAAVWTNGSGLTLGAFDPGLYSKAYAVNARGDVVGEADASRDELLGLILSYPHPFLWSRGVMTDLGLLPETEWGRAYSINNNGDCAGECYDEDGAEAFSYAVVWMDGEISALGALPGGHSAIAYDINAKRQVVGTSEVGEAAGLAGRGAIVALTAPTGGGLLSVDVESIIKVHVTGSDALGKIVYEADWTAVELAAVAAGESLASMLPTDVMSLTAEVTYLDAFGAEQIGALSHSLR